MISWFRDLRYAFRQLCRSPRGHHRGANGVVFSVLNG
jgi:hypothetical protein